MAVENVTVILLLGIFFNYLFLYKQSKLLGNIFNLALGIAILYLNTNLVNNIVGIIITLGSIANTIFDLLVPKR